MAGNGRPFKFFNIIFNKSGFLDLDGLEYCLLKIMFFHVVAHNNKNYIHSTHCNLKNKIKFLEMTDENNEKCFNYIDHKIL